MDDNAHFWAIIDVEETQIPGLNRLENLLNKLQQQPYDIDTLLDNTDALIRIFEGLCANCYPLFKTIDMKKKRKTYRIKLCTLDFDDKPLMFAKQALAYQNIPKPIELELINLINNMREKYPNLLNDILDEEYNEIKSHHRDKIVITVLGSTKASKSSLINFLLEDEICPTGNQAATARLTKITYGKQLRLTLINSSKDDSHVYLFNDKETLLKKATELIILKNEDRKSTLCEDEIVIELPIEELKNVELWDVPGFDENPIINNRIKEILKDTDLILAVLAQQESLRQTAIDFIKPCLITQDKTKPVTKICFIISQIDKYKPDKQSKETKEEFLQHIYDKIQQELPMNFKKNDYKSSDQFIPMCSNPIHSLKDYLECREQFIKKSCQWFNNALLCLTIHRTNILLKSIKEFSTYENIFRQKIRYDNTKEIFNKRFIPFSEELTEKVNKKLHEIHLLMKLSIEDIATECRKLFYTYESLETIEEYIQSRLTTTFKQMLTLKNSEIIQIISTMSTNFSYTIELKPPEIQILKQVLNDTLTKDYYKNIIEQHQHTSPYHLSAYLTRIFHALSETLIGTLKIPTGDFGKFRQAVEKFSGRERYVEENTINSITGLVHEVLDTISNELQRQTEKTLKDILNSQLNRMHQQIEKKAQKYIHSSVTEIKINHLRQFSTRNLMKINRIHLDTLDIQFGLEYSSNYEINHHERLDKNSNFPVFAGTLGKNQLPIAAKLIPIKDFKLQEVFYMRELKHQNVIKYYGVKKANESEYYIIMPRLDCNLKIYLKDYSKTFNPIAIDEMIIQIIKGLNYIHTQLELIHRDIKLENILVRKSKKFFFIADLGGVHPEPITRIYTEGYAPPEFFSTDNSIITEKFDIYSLGIVIKEIIRLADLEQYNDGLILNWSNLAKKCRSKDPSERPSCERLLQLRSKYVAQ